MSILESPVRFYSIRERPYGAFSNFSRHSVEEEVNGEIVHWATAEHAFQAAKFDPFSEAWTKVLETRRPSEMKKVAWSYRIDGKEWESRRLDVMRSVVFAKFSQNTDLSELLLATGNRQIIEAAPRDRFWGEGRDRKGKNWLGRILMEIRQEI